MTTQRVPSAPVAKDRQLVVRIEAALYERIEAFFEAEKASSRYPIKLSDVLRDLLEAGLEAREAKRHKR